MPIAGIISNKNAKDTAREYNNLNNQVKKMGGKFSSPFMTLSFMALLVIPKIKIGDKGLVDVETFELISLFLKPER